MRKFIFRVKKIISYLKPTAVNKRRYVLKNLKKDFYNAKTQLYKSGFVHIKKCNLNTWKFYNKNYIRFTMCAYLGDKKYFIKCARGFDSKMDNSIKFQQLFNDVFDFIPKGNEIILKGFKCYITEFKKCDSFSDFTHYASYSTALNLLFQANHIVDSFEKFNLVHCDLESVNVLIERKTNKLIIIDFDTCCSEKNGLFCSQDEFPNYTIKIEEKDKIIYDDAYSFVCLFKRLNVKGIQDTRLYNDLVNKIGRNVHVVLRKEFTN